jgi:hypothetical protein
MTRLPLSGRVRFPMGREALSRVSVTACPGAVVQESAAASVTPSEAASEPLSEGRFWSGGVIDPPS